MDNFDPTVRGAIEIAQTEALRRKNNQLTEHHLLLGLIKHPNSVCSKALKKEKKVILGVLDQVPTVSNLSLDQIQPSSKFSEWLTLASSEAIQAGRTGGITEADLLRHYKKFFPQLEIEVPEQDDVELPEFLSDLNELANNGKLDPVIGRSKEIRRVQEILCRRTKNNPVLVGAPGVGKTAIIEGLAGLIQKNQVPDIIQGKTIYSLNMGALMAGTKYRGEFEQRIDSLIRFLRQEGREAILFIDEIHLLIGAGKTEGAMDAANLLKPALSRGELNCIGATTLEEYKKYIESDSALERRFHQVKVNEPTKEDTIQILLGLREKLEIHHGIEITEEAIIGAVYLSDQYISDRQLPDKAIDIIDEGSAGLKLSADSMPPELIEKEALIRSKKVLASYQQNRTLKEELKVLEEEFAVMKQDWEEKVLELKHVANLKSHIEKAQFNLEKAETEGNYEDASRLKYGEIPELEEKLKECKVSWRLTRENIGEVIARSTGVPIERILRTHQENMLHLEEFLNDRVFGQEEALKEISDILIASHAGLSDETRPMGSFLILGPSGVGKTETAKALSQYFFHDEKHLIRIDLSEYRESHAVAKLIGAPPGYVGYEKGGILTEAVRRKPYSILLFDEIEKAHPDFSDILLQILDDGRLTDTQGRTVNFKNTIVFLTSNLKDYQSFFKPEVLGRIDEILHYQQLESRVYDSLLNREVDLLNEKLHDREIQVQLDDELREKIKKVGFDEQYGARPLKGAFNRLVIRPISKELLKDVKLKGNYVLSLENNVFQFNHIS